MYARKIVNLSVFIVVTILASSLENAVFGQARAGIKGGLNVSNLYIDDLNDENARFGLNVGLFGQVLASETFAIQPELFYSTKGSQTIYEGIVDQTVKYNINYLDLPVLAVFKLGESAEIDVGPYASYLLNANIWYSGDIVSGDDEIDRDHLKSFDYGLVGDLV